MSDLPSTIARVLELDAAGTPDTFVESIGYTDAKLAAFATTKWLDGVAAVPLAEMAIMVAEDPSVMATLIGALRHARTAAPLLARECERLQELALDRWEEAEELRILLGNASQESLEGLVQRAHRDRDTARAEVARFGLRLNRFDCAECGRGVAADEDHCCVTCGADCDAYEDGALVSGPTFSAALRTEAAERKAEKAEELLGYSRGDGIAHWTKQIEQTIADCEADRDAACAEMERLRKLLKEGVDIVGSYAPGFTVWLDVAGRATEVPLASGKEGALPVATAAEVLADLGPVLEALVPPRPEDWSGCASHATPHRHCPECNVIVAWTAAKTRLSTAPEEKSE